MSAVSITDRHTMFVGCPGATEAQLRADISAALEERRKVAPLECLFRVNMVTNSDGGNYGMAFVFFTNPDVYCMIMGRNIDGTPRVEYKDDPSYVPPTPSHDWSAQPAPTNWADWVDEIDITPKIPQIMTKLEPLMTLRPYTPEGEDEAREYLLSRAIAQPLDSKFAPNVLKCNLTYLSSPDGSPTKFKGIPEWITSNRLKSEFAPYASNMIRGERSIKGVGTETGYPHVTITTSGDRIAFIVFDPATTDALFALIMFRKLVLPKRDYRGQPVIDPNGNPVTATLIFTHAYRTDRDGAPYLPASSKSKHRRTPGSPSRPTSHPREPRGSYQPREPRGSYQSREPRGSYQPRAIARASAHASVH
jgi:hypothetical protein